MNDIQVKVEITRLTPAVAELRLVASELGELRGRIMGPRSPHATTIEIAYPLKPVVGADAATATVVIPEPNLWDEITKFIYWGPVGLWRDGSLVGQSVVEVGIKGGSP